VAGGLEPGAEGAEAAHAEGGVRLARGTEAGLDAEVERDALRAEPDAAAGGEACGLRGLGEAEEVAVEGARRRLAAGGHRELDVVDRQELQGRLPGSGQAGLGDSRLTHGAGYPT